MGLSAGAQVVFVQSVAQVLSVSTNQVAVVSTDTVNGTVQVTYTVFYYESTFANPTEVSIYNQLTVSDAFLNAIKANAAVSNSSIRSEFSGVQFSAPTVKQIYPGPSPSVAPTVKTAALSVYQSSPKRSVDVILIVSIVLSFLCLAMVVSAIVYNHYTHKSTQTSILSALNRETVEHRQPQRTNDPELVDWPHDLFAIITEAEKRRLAEKLERQRSMVGRRIKGKQRFNGTDLVDWPDELFD